jgi:Mg/Co/Ni transporter MgtE
MKKQFIVGLILGFITVFIIVISVIYIFANDASFKVG